MSSLSVRSANPRCAMASLLALILLALASEAHAQSADGSAWVAPERAARRTDPVAHSAVVVNRGRTIFHRDCELCHGVSGRGDGPMSHSLPLKPADLSSTRVQSQTDGAIFWKLSEGRGVMPSTQSMLSDEERWSLIQYIRTLSAGRAKRSR